MDTSIFRYVLEVEKYRNITQAAKRLFISQPALTKQLNKLEKELGFSPFDRTHSPISVTPQGEISRFCSALCAARKRDDG